MTRDEKAEQVFRAWQRLGVGWCNICQDYQLFASDPDGIIWLCPDCQTEFGGLSKPVEGTLAVDARELLNAVRKLKKWQS